MSGQLELESLFKNTSVFAYQLGLASSLPILFMSESVQEILGYSADKIEFGKTSFLSFIDKNDQESLTKFIDDINLQDSSLMVKMVCNDGSIIHTKHYIKKRNGESGEYLEALVIDVHESVSNKTKLESEKGFSRHIMQAMQDGFAFVNPDFTHGIVNQSFIDTTGFTLDELVGTKPPYPYWPEEELPKITAAFEEAIMGKLETYELVFSKKSGERFPVLISPSPVFDDHNNLKCYLAVIKDISEIKRTQRALEESEQKFRMISEQALMSVVLVQGMKVIYCNDSFCKLTGYLGEEVAQWNIGQFFELMHPAYKEFVKEQYRKKIIGDEHAITNYKLKLIKKTGEERWAELWSKQVDYNGKPADLIMMIDVNDNKIVEENLKRSKSWYKTLFDKSSEAILTLEDSKITAFNKKAIKFFNRKPSELDGKELDSLIPSGKEMALLENISSNANNGKFRFEQTFDVNGDIVETEVGISSQKVGGKSQVMLSIRDISEIKEHERKLIADLGYTSNVLANLPVGIGIVNKDGIITYFNKQFTRQYGYELEDFSQVNDWYEKAYPDEVYRKSIVNKWEGMIQENIESKTDVPFLANITTKDGIEKLTEISFDIINDEIFTVFNDLSEIEKSHRKLKESELMIQAIIDSVPIRLFWKDKNSVYKGCNKMFFDDTGLPEGETVEGKTDFDFAWQDEASKYRVDDANIIKSGTPKISYEELQERSNGVKNWVRTSKVPLLGASGDIIGLLGCYDDITNLKKIESELLDHKNNLEKLVEEQTAEVILLNKELTQANEEMISSNNRLHEQKEFLEQALTKLKVAQAQLVQSEKMASLGVLMSGIAHEINNPVNFISSGLEALEVVLKSFKVLIDEYDKINEDNYQAQFEEINRIKQKIKFNFLLTSLDKVTMNMRSGVRRTTEIIKSLRVFSRADEGELQEANINEMIESTLVILYNQYKDRIDVNKDFDDVVFLDCYPGKLSQVFMNLISNSIQAIEGEGNIWISTQVLKDDNGQKVEVIIKDTGNGIPHPIRNKIFEPFFTTKPVGEGTGLGLAISYGIIQEHKGKLELSHSDKNGTVFTINLPVR